MKRSKEWARYFSLVATPKNEETKRFLENLSTTRNIFKEIKGDGTIFIKERLPDGTVKIIDVTNVYSECTKLVKEMRGE